MLGIRRREFITVVGTAASAHPANGHAGAL
jgi:hypothetical protein